MIYSNNRYTDINNSYLNKKKCYIPESARAVKSVTKRPRTFSGGRWPQRPKKIAGARAPPAPKLVFRMPTAMPEDSGKISTTR